jgi:tripartite-type tricarboxylate transporter receptor subunit TctC
MNRRDMLARLAATGAAAATAMALPARAAINGYPTKPVKVVVPFTAGGGTDLVARALTPGFTEVFGQSFIVENKPGASTVIGSEYVAKSAPDGHTLLLTSVPLATNPWLMKNLPFDTAKAFAPISLVVQSPFIMVVPPASPIASLDDLVARAKGGSKLSFGSTGSGTADHLAMELFCLQSGISIVHVAYKGTGPALADVMGGHVDLMFANVVGAAPLLKAGKLRALAASTAHRSALLPEVKTVKELSGKPFDVSAWTGLLAPAGTDPAIVASLGAELKKTLAVPATRDFLVANGADPVGSTPAEFTAFIAREMETWGKIIKTANITTS